MVSHHSACRPSMCISFFHSMMVCAIRDDFYLLYRLFVAFFVYSPSFTTYWFCAKIPPLSEKTRLFFLVYPEYYIYHSNFSGSEELGSVAGPVIQANVRLTFEEELRSGGLLCYTGLANSMVTLEEPRDG